MVEVLVVVRVIEGAEEAEEEDCSTLSTLLKYALTSGAVLVPAGDAEEEGFTGADSEELVGADPPPPATGAEDDSDATVTITMPEETMEVA